MVYSMNNRKLVRPKRGRMIAGVARGLANYFGLPVAFVRIVWFLLLLPGGLPGVIPYVILWLVIPSENSSIEPA
jgi:phage shock protein C